MRNDGRNGLTAGLNTRGMQTRRGGSWQVSTVSNLLKRIVRQLIPAD